MVNCQRLVQMMSKLVCMYRRSQKANILMPLLFSLESYLADCSCWSTLQGGPAKAADMATLERKQS